MSDQRIERLHYLFNPGSIAIIGASSNPAKPGGQPLAALLKSGYQGSIFPVNPRYSQINGLKCYQSLEEIPEIVDLAIIAVPAEMTPDTLRQCVKMQVKTAIIFTSGFGETSPEGQALQDELVKIASTSRLRFAGPNCLGIVNAPARIMANFAIADQPEKVVKSNTFAFISQSGGFGTIAYAEAQKQGLGAEILVSTGNEADLDFTDYLTYIVEYTQVKAVGAYLEGLKDGQKFYRAADAALAKGIPLVVLKVGKHQAAARAAQSHTGSLAGNNQIYQGFFLQKGIIRVDSIEEMIAMFNLFADGKWAKGKKIGILSTSGGGSVYISDLCVEEGLEIASLSQASVKKLRAILPPFASVTNPIDLTSQAMVEQGLLKNSLEILLSDPQVDLAMVYFNVVGENSLRIIEELHAVYQQFNKPLMAIAWAHHEKDNDLANNHLRSLGIPTARQLDHSIKALSALADFSLKRQSTIGKNQNMPVTKKSSVLSPGREYLNSLSGTKLTEYQVKKLLKFYDIPVVPEETAISLPEAIQQAESIGYPVALKILSPEILHKTELGGVKLNLKSAADLQKAYEEIMSNVTRINSKAPIDGVLVQKMLPPGRELIVGIKHDQTFGNSLLVGLGGIFVEIIKDFASAVPPLDEQEALAMLRSLKGYAILEKFRNQNPVDIKELVGILLNLSRLALDLEGILEELEINPLIIGEAGKGIYAVDALLILKNGGF